MAADGGVIGYPPWVEPVQPIHVEARDGYRIRLEYADGAAGELDLSHLAEKPIFHAWRDRAFFEQVHVTAHRTIAWDGDIELCADALYSDLTGLSWDEMYPLPASAEAHA